MNWMKTDENIEYNITFWSFSETQLLSIGPALLPKSDYFSNRTIIWPICDDLSIAATH